MHLTNGKLKDLREQLVKNPFSVDFSAVTKRDVSTDVGGSAPEMIYRDMATRVGAILNTRVLRALSNHLGDLVQDHPNPIDRAWELFSQNPYAPIRTVAGYAFLGADSVGSYLNVPFDSDFRMAAMATYALDEGCVQSGHTYLTPEQLRSKLSALDHRISPDAAVSAAIRMGEPIVMEQGRCYLRWLLACELKLAKALKTRHQNPVAPIYRKSDGDFARDLAFAQSEAKITLDESQRQALTKLLHSTSSIHTVTAGPGCGKTAIMEILVSMIGNSKKFLFCAPTGVAAKVLSARVGKWGVMAQTIHATLGVVEGGFNYNEANLLPADIIIADETSMDDLMLGTALISAVGPHTHIIFLGDTKQLPSVGPGNFLADLVKLPFDHHRLTTTHRNAGGILDAVNLVGNGQVSYVDREDVRFSPMPPADDAGIATVIEEYTNAVASYNGNLAKVGLLIARRKGQANVPGWNTTYLNTVLRERFNPDGEKIVGTTLFVGDRIIIRSNQALNQGKGKDGKDLIEEVVNGDKGFIQSYHLKDGEKYTVEKLMLKLDDGRTISYPAGTMDKLELGYAMTVHLTQGSEFEHVIFMGVNGSPSFIHRGILFTGWSRAKKHLHIYGDQAALMQIAAREIPARNSGVVEWFGN